MATVEELEARVAKLEETVAGLRRWLDREQELRAEQVERTKRLVAEHPEAFSPEIRQRVLDA